MKTKIAQSILVSLIFFLAGCTAVQKLPTEQLRITDRPDAVYEDDVLPFIVEQINHTAATFFYDSEKRTRSLKEQGLPVRMEEPAGNFIVGDKEIGGVCMDYASHFIDNYKGLGEIYYVGVSHDGETKISRRIKPFERGDIIIENPHPLVRDYNVQMIKDFYRAVLGEHRKNSRQGWAWWGYSMHGDWGNQLGEWQIGPYILNSNKDRSLYLIEEIPIPTPKFHAGETDIEKFSNHAWVRIIWRDRTIDVDPTWYDNGAPLDFGAIEEIITDY